MKKIFTIAAAAAMIFGAASCQREDLLNGKDGDSKVVFNVEIPEVAVTRADMSDGSTVNELVWEVYVGDKRMYNGREEGSKQFVLELNLVTGQTYDLLFWAQVKDNQYYDVEDLREVNVNYNGPANDETRDAFYGAVLEFEATGIATSETVNLYRPFAQINFGSAPKDWEKAQPFIAKDENGNGGLLSKVTMTDVYTQFNVAKGDVVASSKKKVETLTYALCPASETKYANDYLIYKDPAGNELKYGWVAMNYVLAPKSESSMNTVKASFVHNMNDDSSALEKEVLNVPFKQNYRTNILGEIFTGGNKFTVEIVPGFANDPIENFPDYTIAEPVLFALENGGSVTLTEDTPIPGNVYLDNKQNVVINLNGHKLIYNSAQVNGNTSLIMVRVNDGASLTINGNGKDGSGIVSNGYIASANAGGKIVVNGGTFEAGDATTFQANGGDVYITGGTFKLTGTESTFLLNHRDSQKDAGLISVSGGTFHGFNPGNSNSENPPMSFLAYGYESVDNGDGTYTVKKAKRENVTLLADVRTVSSIPVADLDGDNKTITADFSATTSEHIVDAQGSTYIHELTIKGSNKRNANTKVQRGLFLSNITEDTAIKHLKISDVGYTINTGGGIASDKSLLVELCDLEGWTSIASFASVKFKQCEFIFGDYFNKNEDPTWNGCLRVGTTTVVEGCWFDKGFYISLDTLPEGGKLTFVNCYVDGVTLTKENVAAYLNESEEGTLSRIIFANN